MIIDTTISTADNQINMQAHCEFASKKQRFFPRGEFESRKEQLEFRDLYVRDFLETNGLDSNIDLRSTVVFWKNGEVVSVLSCRNSISDRSQNVAELLA